MIRTLPPGGRTKVSTGATSARARGPSARNRQPSRRPTEEPPEGDGGPPVEAPAPGTVDYRLEVVVLPVTDVDRAKQFYVKLGWREDADFPIREGFRVI